MADYSFVISGDFKSTGGIFAATENGDNLQDIIEDLSTAYCIDDMVFDSKGGFYFTDFQRILYQSTRRRLLCFAEL